MQQYEYGDGEMTELSITYTVDELELLGRLFGDGDFPGLPMQEPITDAYAAERLDAAVLRGLLLRDVVRAEAESLELTAPHAALLELVLAPECVVTVERLGAGGDDVAERVLFHASNELTLRHGPGRAGIRLFSAFETPWLIVRALDEAGVVASNEGATSAPDAFDRVVDIGVVWRDEHEVHEGTVRVGIDSGGMTYVLTGGQAAPTTPAELHGRLAALLPPIEGEGFTRPGQRPG